MEGVVTVKIDRLFGWMMRREQLSEPGRGSCFTRPFCTTLLGTEFKLSSDGGTKLIRTMQVAHIAAAKATKIAGVILFYNPNLRLPLLPFEESAREGIVSKWEMADIIKVSEEEVSFLTKGDDASFDVVRKSFHPKLKLLLVTEGPKGCRYYTKSYVFFLTFARRVEGLKVDAVDTTGAGDAFVGGILAQLAEDDTWLEDEKLTKRCTMVCEWLRIILALSTKEDAFTAIMGF